jgi:prophage regulatory protein
MVTNVALLRPKTVYKLRGKSRSSHYKDIDDGLFVPPIQIGDRAVATPDYEVYAMISAQIEGRSKEELRSLVNELVASRRNLPKRRQP